nr:reverse transcriptase domain-containing protein [Tanacetum cinerariifolium]
MATLTDMMTKLVSANTASSSGSVTLPDDNIFSRLPSFSAITPDEPVLSTEEPDNSLSMGDEHLDTISATELDQFINSSVEDLIPILSESEGIPNHMACPHHGFSELHQLDTFYNALNVNDQDSLNSAAGGNFLDKMPRECMKIIESKSKVRQSRAKAIVAKVGTSSSTPVISSDIAELKDKVKALLLDKKN